MTKESARDAFCEQEYEHFGASPFTILDAIGAKVVEQYAQMIDELQQSARLGLSKAQQDTFLSQWTMHFDDTLNQNFQLFEAYCIRNVFSIPEGHAPNYRLQCGAVEGEVDTTALDSELATVVNDLQKAAELKAKLKTEAARIDAERQMLERIESLFQSLKDAVDGPFSAAGASSGCSFEQTMVFVADQTANLLSIVNGTLEAASNFLHPKSSSDDRQGTASNAAHHGMYEQLLKELITLDPDAMASKENKMQAEAHDELRGCLEVASLADIQVHQGLKDTNRRHV